MGREEISIEGGDAHQLDFDLEEQPQNFPRLGPLVLTPTNKRKLIIAVGAAVIAVFVLMLGGFLAYSIISRNAEEEGENGMNDPELIRILDRLSSSERTIRTHLQYLASDLLQGRGTGTIGEEMAVSYISTQLSRLNNTVTIAPQITNATKAAASRRGKETRDQISDSTVTTLPANPQWFQPVPLFGSTPYNTSQLVVSDGVSPALSFQFGPDFVFKTDTTKTFVDLDADSITFVGYGIDAPEYEWNDYKDFDATGKVLIMFVNDPPANETDPTLFGGIALTYYGRWMYKYEEARRRNAKAVFLIHTDQMAGYPFTVLNSTAFGEHIQPANSTENQLDIAAWITQSTADSIARLTGNTFSTWLQMASLSTFQPQTYSLSISLQSSFTNRFFDGSNVLAMIRGSKAPNEVIFFTSHHDHFGVGTPDSTGDGIFNGALDNASGVSLLLTIAEAFQGFEPERSIVFASVTAEESGLLGSEYLVSHLSSDYQVIADINYDALNMFGATGDIAPLYDLSYRAIYSVLEMAAGAEGMTISPDTEPEQGHLFRSDQLPFVKRHMPAADISSGCDFVGKPESYCLDVLDGYRNTHYHQPSDEYDESWSMDGVIQVGRVGIRMAYAMSRADFDFVIE